MQTEVIKVCVEWKNGTNTYLRGTDPQIKKYISKCKNLIRKYYTIQEIDVYLTNEGANPYHKAL